MKKLIISLIFLSVSLNAYSFWIWSPKTQKWKNPRYSAMALPYLQYEEGLNRFEDENYKEAYREFRKLVINYPDAKEAADGQYYIGRCLEEMGKPYEAFLAYQKVIDSYPNSQRITEIVEREYNIGEDFLGQENKKVLGISVYDFVDHPAIEIFQRIVASVPYSEYAPKAQYKMGMVLMELGRFDEARDAFQKVIDDYSDSEWGEPAKYQLALAAAKAFPGADYDDTYLQEATERLDEFIADHPEAKISTQAQEQLKELRNKEAKKNFDIGKFYEKQSKYKGAVIYYEKVVNNFPDSDYYSEALKKLEELKVLVEGGLTKKELIRKEKQEAAEERREEKIRRKEEAKRKKEELTRERQEEKQRRIEEKQALKDKSQQQVEEAQEVEVIEYQEDAEAIEQVEPDRKEIYIEESVDVLEEEDIIFESQEEEIEVEEIEAITEEDSQSSISDAELIRAYREAKQAELLKKKEEAKIKKAQAIRKKKEMQAERRRKAKVVEKLVLIEVKEEAAEVEVAKEEDTQSDLSGSGVIKAYQETEIVELVNKKEESGITKAQALRRKKELLDKRARKEKILADLDLFDLKKEVEEVEVSSE